VAVLLENEFVRLELDPARHLVRFTRTATGYDSTAAFERMIDRLVDAMTLVDRPRHVLLADLRLSPIRSGPDFDPAAARFAREVLGGFARTAVLVGTKIGALQTSRYQKEHGGPEHFTTEAAALVHLQLGP
jgi:hypothetical protein